MHIASSSLTTDHSNIPMTGLNCSFTKKRLTDHFRDAFHYYKKTFLIAGFSLLASAWLIIEIGSYFLGWQFRGLPSFALVLFFSFLLSTILTWRQYLNHIPAGFEAESAASNRIAHLMPAHWEARLAVSLLEPRLELLDQEMKTLEEQGVYVKIEKRIDSISEYTQWLTVRTDNLSAMLNTFHVIVIDDYLKTIYSTDGYSATPSANLDMANRVEKLYKSSIDFEYENLKTMPPKEWGNLYRLQLGWANPIREGIQELFQILEKARDVKIGTTENSISHIISLREPRELLHFTNLLVGSDD